jgi:Domain of unknown function (DUF3825)
MAEGRALYDFAYIHMIDERLQDLALLAEPESWDYKCTARDRPNPILYYYFHYTFERIKEQNKIAYTADNSFCCFNTGLVTTHQEAIFALLSKNREVGREPWRFVKFCRRGEFELSKFPSLPDLATYFEDPSCLVFDSRLELRINVEHIITENRERFPEPFKSMADYALQVLVKGAIDNVKERVRRNYKVAVPQYYKGAVQLLLPLCFANPTTADLALLLQRHEGHYRAATCLTLDMAYNNARQLAKPDREWLNP